MSIDQYVAPQPFNPSHLSARAVCAGEGVKYTTSLFGWRIEMSAEHTAFWMHMYVREAQEDSSNVIDVRVGTMRKYKPLTVLDALVATLEERTAGEPEGSFWNHFRQAAIGDQYQNALNAIEKAAYEAELAKRKRDGTPKGLSGWHDPVTHEERPYTFRN